MSELRVTTERVLKVEKHPNADKLDIIQVLGWNCVVEKDTLKENDLVVYFPIDCILSEQLNEILFSGGKIKLTNGRIKTIKLRGVISQGLAVPVSVIEKIFTDLKFKEGENIADVLGIKKYEPPENRVATMSGAKQEKKIKCNPNFIKYTDINHGKNFPNAMRGEAVVITEKIHGCNSRVSFSLISGNFFIRFIKSIKNLLLYGRKRWGYEFCIGSHNNQLKTDNTNKTYYKDIKKSVWHLMAEKYDLRNVLKNGEEIFFEIYGSTIQKGYTYGLPAGHLDMVAFDLLKDGEYMNWDDAKNRFMEMGVPIVPELYRGFWSDDLVDKYVSGISILSSKQPIREGFVVKPTIESVGHMGRKIVKYINPKYLLKEPNETNFPH